MNYKLLLLPLLLATTMAGAQNYTKMSRSLCRIAQQTTTAMRGKSFTGNNSKITVFIKGDEEAIAPFCLRHQGDIHIANVPVNQLSTLSEDSRIRYMEASALNHSTKMDHALATVQADKAQQGFNLPQAFDGRGVLCGNIDIAHDYSHPTFRSTADGRLRIVRAWDWFNIPAGTTGLNDSNFPLGTLYTDTTAINLAQYSDDSSLSYHGTHTSSIMAGSGWGSAFRGVAPEADIYMTTVMMGNNKELIPETMQKGLTTATEALAFQNIFDYADSIAQPCVINYSAGGSQDITDEDALLNEYFSRMTGPGKIIVASAGNEGIMPHNMLTVNSANTTGGGRMQCENDNTQQVSIRTRGGSNLSLYILDTTEPNPEATAVKITLDCTQKGDDIISASGLVPYEHNTIPTDSRLSGMTITVYPGYDGFDHDYIGYDILLYKGEKDFTTNDFALILKTEDNGEAQLFSPNINLLPADISSETHLAGGTPGSTIISPGCLPSVIAVGATTWRTSYTTPDGEEPVPEDYGTPGTRASFSSVGPTLHGITKPDVMAPGAYIASAYNHVYESLHGDPYNFCAAETDFGGTTYYYTNDSGTSMSAPIVSGVIALWLQADPTLTTERIMQVIAKTSRHPAPSLAYPNNFYGHGEINAYAGLLEVLGISGIQGISHQHVSGATVLPTADGNISITFAEETTTPLHCRLYTPNGTVLKSITLPRSTKNTLLPTDSHSGIIIVQIDGCGSSVVRVR